MTHFTTYTGRTIDFANPQPDQISLYDITHHLSLEPRFGGKTETAYSVAAHSVFTAKIAAAKGFSPTVQLHCLLHDAHEAYLKDIPTPLKKLLPDYQRIAARFDRVIAEHFALPRLTDAEQQAVKLCDLIALKMEKDELLNDESDWAQLVGIERVDLIVPNLPPRRAEYEFAVKYRELMRRLEMRDWIKTSEKLPEENDEILFITDGGMWLGMFFKGKFDADTFIFDPEETSHWQYAPHPPKELQ